MSTVNPFDEIIERLDRIEKFLSSQQPTPQPEQPEKWLNLDELIKMLPSKPKRNTVYGWVAARKIPFHKTGKVLAFRESEINSWLVSGRVLTMDEIEAEAEKCFKGKRA